MTSLKRTVSALLALLIIVGVSPDAYSQGAVCTVGGAEYESLSEAVRDVMGGGVSGEITLLSDAELDVGSISAPVAVAGNGHSVSIPAQSASESGALNINSTLSFSNAVVSFSNPKNWSITLSSNGKLELLAGTDCSFTVCGIYSSPGGEITVDASRLLLSNMEYTCMMAEAYAELFINNGSEFLISAPVNINGITGFNIYVDASRFTVKDCKRQGLVKCGLTLKNAATADISGNGYGYNMYSYNVLTVNEGTSLNMQDNTSGAILMQGRSTVNIKAGGKFSCTGNGGGWLASNTDADYGSKAAINIGWFSSEYIYTTGAFNIEDGAQASISGNFARGISNYGTARLGSGTEIVNNGALKAGESSAERRIERGGGIKNNGSLTLSSGAAVYNNHASLAADDIFNADASKLSLPAVGSGWVLGTTPDTNDCGETITGWYLDRENSRWKAHGAQGLYAEEQKPGEYSDELELKAAHGIFTAPQTGDETPLILWGLLAMSSAALVLIIRRKQKKNRA